MSVTRKHKYYFVEVNYHDLTTKKEDEARMSEYGPVVHDEHGTYWLVAKPKKQVSNALCRLGYALVSTDKKPL